MDLRSPRSLSLLSPSLIFSFLCFKIENRLVQEPTPQKGVVWRDFFPHLPQRQATQAAERSVFPGRWAPGGGRREGLGRGSAWAAAPAGLPGRVQGNVSAIPAPERSARGGGVGGGWEGVGARGAGHLETAGGRALIGRAAASAFQPGAPPPAPSTPEGISSSGGRYCCPPSLFGSDRVTIVSKLCPCGAPAWDPGAPSPSKPPPHFFFCSLLIMTSSDSGEQERGMGRGGELARSWRPLLRDVFNYNFLKSLFRGFGAFKFFLLPPHLH